MQIEAAAQAVITERGFTGASMLEVARRANASNETLYRWYKDKNGLFAALVERNASAGMQHLQAALVEDRPLADKLTRFGVALLTGILSDSAVELNRAAAVDPTGALGQMIAQHGRDKVVPMLETLLERDLVTSTFDDPRDAAETFIFLLVGDLQARRVIGQVPPPDAAACLKRATRATERFLFLASWPTGSASSQ